MANRSLHTSEELNQHLRYEADTGRLFWKQRPVEYFSSERAAKSWNTRHANKEAFLSDNGKGYLIGTVEYQCYYAHRVIWCMTYGYWPAEIDHINWDKSDNRLVNLRDVSHAENAANQPMRANNTSGIPNVRWESGRGKWTVRIRKNGKRVSVGRFDCIARAMVAMREAKISGTVNQE